MNYLRGFGSGAAAGCAFVIVTLIGRAAEAIPTLPELVQDRLVLLMPGPLFSLLLDRFLYLGKPLLFGSLLAGQVVLLGFAGIAVARWGRPVIAALLLWLVTGFILLPIAKQGVFVGRTSIALETAIAFAVYAIWRAVAQRRPFLCPECRATVQAD